MVLRAGDPRRRRGGRSVLLALVVISLFVPMSALAAGASARGEPPAAAAVDSLRLATFLRLPAAERDQRTAAAQRLRQEAAAQPGGLARLGLLEQAVQADPASATGWLELAELQRLMGHRSQAAASAAAARTAFEPATGDERRELVRRYCLLRAWLAYDLGDWTAGEQWAGRAIKRDAGLPGWLIHGLNHVAGNVSFSELEHDLAVWRPVDTNTNRRLNVNWIYICWLQLHDVGSPTDHLIDDVAKSTKQAEHDLERWRDYALICEARDERALAERYHRKAVRCLPVANDGWLAEHAGLADGLPASATPLPFWTNAEGDYVAGSLLAHLAWAHDRLRAVAGKAEHAAWAQRVVDTADAAVDRHVRHPWTRLWRAEAFLALDQVRNAEEDVNKALAYFAKLELDEPELDAITGRVCLRDQDLRGAVRHLAAAAERLPDQAALWADLGLAHAQRHDRAAARQAFARALALDRESAVVWHNRGVLNLEEGQTDAALHDLERALTLAPHDTQIVADLQRAQRGAQLLRARAR